MLWNVDNLYLLGHCWKYTQANNKECRHLANMDKQQFWMNNLTKRFPGYAKVIAELPSLRSITTVTSSQVFLDSCMEMMKHRDYLFKFSKKQAFRKWRFTVSKYKKKAIEKFCHRITKGMDWKEVLVGMGDWNDDNPGIIKGPRGDTKKGPSTTCHSRQDMGVQNIQDVPWVWRNRHPSSPQHPSNKAGETEIQESIEQLLW